MSGKTNYFDGENSAQRYQKGRPFFHREAINHLKSFLKLETKLEKALDIACGTGFSTKALLDIAQNVYGSDISFEMIKLAENNDKINLSIALAEQQPFSNEEFDLITVSSGVHWFDIDKFLQESNRILKTRAWLVIYDNFFISEMEGVQEFTDWFPKVYLQKFPSPPRNNRYDWTNQNLNPHNFEFAAEKSFKNSVIFTREQLAFYFTTQSNIINAVQNGAITYQKAENWLNNQLSPFFPINNSFQTINYGNNIKFIQKQM